MRPYVLPLLITLGSTAPSLAQQKPGVAPDVVVTATRLSDSERALKECIARKCPVDQDVAATLAHAENQFVAGKYADARKTLLAGRARTQRFAKQYPVPVSNLLRANARIAAHLGEGEAYRVGTYDTLSALKAGLPADDPRVLGARVEVGDMLARFGQFEGAEEAYRSVARRAHQLNLPDVEGFALFRVGALYSSYAESAPDIYASGARRALDELIANPDPRLKVFVRAARLLRARNAARSGDAREIDALLAEYRTDSASDRPVLLYAPPIPQLREANREQLGGGALSRVATRLFEDQWVDISFYVAPDGHVTDAGVLRKSSKLESEDWVKPIITGIGARRYAPLKRDPNDPGILRVERYTLTSRWEEQLGSRIRQRSPVPQIEQLDLSNDPAPAKPKG